MTLFALVLAALAAVQIRAGGHAGHEHLAVVRVFSTEEELQLLMDSASDTTTTEGGDDGDDGKGDDGDDGDDGDEEPPSSAIAGTASAAVLGLAVTLWA
eukprot:s435_g3.t1